MVDMEPADAAVMDVLRSAKFRRRFYAKVADSANGCQVWTASINSSGYGMISVQVQSKTVIMGAHRAAWMMQADKPVPPGREIDHLCRNRTCTNPRHLEVVTHSENSVRKQSIPDATPTHHPTMRIRQARGRTVYQVLWRQIMDGQTKQRGRTFPTQEAADKFIAQITNKGEAA